VAITVAIAAVFSIILTFTRFGRAIYAIGGNQTAARLSGIRVDRVRIAAFALCGMLAGFAGVMLASRTGVGSPNAADGGELDAIAACVIGGASLMGGEGGCSGTVAGALIMNVLVNFCNLKNINSSWQKVLVGALIVVLVYYDNVRKRKAGLLKE
jgi:ribose/xylose/arabinose/galactoside ABC-type transport system permease subunit